MSDQGKAGTASVLLVTAPGGATRGTALSNFLTDYTVGKAKPEIRTTTLGNTDDTFTGGFRSQTFEASGIWEPAAHTLITALLNGSTASPSRDYPHGTASGALYEDFDLKLLTYDDPRGRDDAVSFRITGRVQNLTQGTA